MTTCSWQFSAAVRTTIFISAVFIKPIFHVAASKVSDRIFLVSKSNENSIVTRETNEHGGNLEKKIKAHFCSNWGQFSRLSLALLPSLGVNRRFEQDENCFLHFTPFPKEIRPSDSAPVPYSIKSQFGQNDRAKISVRKLLLVSHFSKTLSDKGIVLWLLVSPLSSRTIWGWRKN